MAAVTDAQIPPLRALCPGPSGDGGQVGSIGQTSPRIHRFGHELNRPRCTPPSLLAIPPQRLREAEHRPPPRIRGSCSIRFRNRLSPSTKSSRAAGTPPCANRAATPIKLSRISPVCENFGALCTTLARSPCTSTKSKRIRRVIADSAWPAPRPASLPRGTGRPKNRSSDAGPADFDEAQPPWGERPALGPTAARVSPADKLGRRCRLSPGSSAAASRNAVSDS